MHFLDHFVGLWDEHFDGIGTIDGHFNFIGHLLLDIMGHWNVDVLFDVMFHVNWNLLK